MLCTLLPIAASAQPDFGAEDVNAYSRDSASNLIDPAEEHITAASPHACRLSDGTSFYDALTESTFTSEDFAQESGGNLDTIAADTTSIDADTTTIIGHVDGIETFLGDINDDTKKVLAFQTSSNLGAGATYSSGILDLQEYTQVATALTADQDGTINIYWYRDAAGTDLLRTLTIPYDGTSGFQLYAAPAFTPYVQYDFVNGATPQGDFYFDTKFLNTALHPQILRVDGTIASGMTTVLNRSITAGLDAQGNYRNAVLDGLAFSTTSNLTNGSTYDSGILDLSAYTQVQTHILASHDGEINIYWYTDSGGTDQVRLLTIPYTAADGFQTFSAPAFTPYVKYTFTNNSGSNQTDFFFDTKFVTKAISAQILTPSGTISNLMTANLTRSIIAGQTTGGGGGYVNVKVNPSGALTTEATSNIVELDGNGIDLGAGNVGAGTQRVTIATDDVNLAKISGWDNAASDGASVSGDTAHDTADAGEPVKVGGKAIDMEPDSGSEEGPTAVAANDRVNQLFDLKGRVVDVPFARYQATTTLDDTYGDTTTTNTSTAIEVWAYRWCQFQFDLTKIGTPTTIQFFVESSANGTDFVIMRNGPLGAWIYDDTYVGASTISETLYFPIAAHSVRVRITGTGSSGNTFTIADSHLYCRN